VLLLLPLPPPLLLLPLDQEWMALQILGGVQLPPPPGC
jgi:hypothetical protein